MWTLRRLWTRARRALFGISRLDRELDAEIHFHLEQETALRIDRGERPDLARLASRRDFGSVALVKETTRSVWVWTRIEQFFQDLQIGARILTTAPALSATAVLLVALVIGGNTTIFSAVHGVMSKPAPGVQHRGLVTLSAVVNGFPAMVVSYREYVDILTQSTTVRPVLGYEFEPITLSHDHGNYSLRGGLVSSNYFETLGIQPFRGRVFSDQENRFDASGLAAIISHRIWQEHFQGAEVLGRSILLNGQPGTIIGVMPAGFQGAWLTGEDVWLPIVSYLQVRGRAHALQDGSFDVQLLGRLTPGSSLSQARAEFAAISTRLQGSHVERRDKVITVWPYSVTAGGNSLVAMHGGRVLAIFSIVTLLTLVIVCANVANLMLGRAVVRQQEMALRQSVGAPRGRIVRMLLAEGLVLSVLAWALACAMAVGVSRVLAYVIPPNNRPELATSIFTPDWQVVAYAMLLAIVGTVAFTLVPAVRTWRQDLLPWLKAGQQGVVQGKSGVSSALVIVQLAFSVLLLTSAGLAYRSLSVLDSLDLRFDRNNLLLVTVSTMGSAATREANGDIVNRLAERLRRLPGATAVSHGRPPAQFWPREPIHRAESLEPIAAERNDIGLDYLKVLGLRTVAGRDFSESDAAGRTTVAVINQGMENLLWPGQSAVGQTMIVGRTRQAVEIAGVAPDAFFSGVRAGARPNFVFLFARQSPAAPGEVTFLLRHHDSLETIAPAIAPAVGEVDPSLPLVSIRTMQEQLDGDEGVWLVRTLTILLTAFALGSLLIAAIGQYAVVAFNMRRRVRDFGVRIALGASATQILRAVLGEGFRLTAIGLTLGLMLSVAVATGLGRFLYGVTPTDLRSYVGVFALLAGASLVACYLPARRAARIDPMQALRHE